MAKKGQTIQLQAEINTDEEWEKFIQRDGLLIVDVYSDWCGPCSGMTANLKKLKLELGGDLLQLGIAKCDHIEALKRFRNKSEPTWLFIVNGKLINLMFGANAPKLIRMITEELKNEQLKREGQFVRTVELEITEMADEEKERYEAKMAVTRAEQEIEERKRREELHERRVQECLNIVENLGNLGVIIVFPHAKDKYAEVLMDVLGEAGLVIGYTDKQLTLHPDILEELLYFDDSQYPDFSYEEHFKKPSIGLVLKRISDDLPGVDEVILQMIYGNKRKFPGDKNCPSRSLTKVTDQGTAVIGVWAPPNTYSKATALKLLFPNYSAPYRLPEAPLSPLHVAMAFDAFKAEEVMELSSKFPGEVMKSGFFTNDMVGEAKLVAKTLQEFEGKTLPPTYEEKIVVQLSKQNPDCYDAFKDLSPCYVSLNAVVGESECKYFFPDGYDMEEKEEKEIKKKTKKKRGKIPTSTADGQAIDESITTDDVAHTESHLGSEADHLESEDHLLGDDESDGEEQKEENELPEDINKEQSMEVDKATSPITPDESTQ